MLQDRSSVLRYFVVKETVLIWSVYKCELVQKSQISYWLVKLLEGCNTFIAIYCLLSPYQGPILNYTFPTLFGSTQPFSAFADTVGTIRRTELFFYAFVNFIFSPLPEVFFLLCFWIIWLSNSKGPGYSEKILIIQDPFLVCFIATQEFLKYLSHSYHVLPFLFLKDSSFGHDSSTVFNVVSEYGCHAHSCYMKMIVTVLQTEEMVPDMADSWPLIYEGSCAKYYRQVYVTIVTEFSTSTDLDNFNSEIWEYCDVKSSAIDQRSISSRSMTKLYEKRSWTR